MKRLIVTADDFGLSGPVNEAVELAHRDGILSTASLMVAAPATEDAVRRARALPHLRVGLHVVLTNGRPILPPERVPALVDRSGWFATSLVRAGLRFFFDQRARGQLDAEIRAQFEAFAKTGLELDHVNAQNHMHVHPTVLALIVRAGRSHGMRAVRVPREPFGPSWRSARREFGARLGAAVLLAPWLRLMTARLRRSGMACNDYVFGMNDTGRMTPERVLRIIENLPDGTSEVYVHPATRAWPEVDPAMSDYAFEEEFAALVDPRVMHALHASGVDRVSFTDLWARRAS